MAKTANITIRIDPETKISAERLFSSFGITITDAISIFLHKSIMEGGLPFEVKQPRFNAETEKAYVINTSGPECAEKPPPLQTNRCSGLQIMQYVFRKAYLNYNRASLKNRLDF